MYKRLIGPTKTCETLKPSPSKAFWTPAAVPGERASARTEDFFPSLASLPHRPGYITCSGRTGCLLHDEFLEHRYSQCLELHSATDDSMLEAHVDPHGVRHRSSGQIRVLAAPCLGEPDVTQQDVRSFS